MDTEIQVETTFLSPKNQDIFDLIIVGAGPAGMSAAICAGRAKLKTLLLDRTMPGGQMSTAYRIHNMPGYPGGILGVDLAQRMESHLHDFGIYFQCESVEDILNPHQEVKIVKTDMNNFYQAKAVILAQGLEPKKLGASFERQFLGRGISYYAQCDGESYRGKDVAVIGGGNCACYAAEYLADFVNRLYLVHESDDIKAVKDLKQRVLTNPRIDVLWNTRLEDVFGVDRVEKVKLLNSVTQQHTWIDVKAVFLYVGRIPPEDIISCELAVDEKGFIITDEGMRTSIKGIYAAGDIRSKQIRQIATSISDGMIAAVNADRDISR